MTNETRIVAPGPKRETVVTPEGQILTPPPDWSLLLPGDPGVTFLKGVALEGSGDRQRAAQHYYRYASTVPSGNASTYAVTRLKSCGMVR